MEYSIVIPTYNEVARITVTLTHVLSFMREFSKEFEILVVDDGSEDNTTSVVEMYSVTNPEIKLIKNPHKGKGPTITTGVLYASGDYIYLADADMATDISELKKLALWVREQSFDIAIASREGIGAQRVNEPLYRHLMGRAFNIYVQLIILPGINDTQCGFKLFKREAAKKIFSKLKVYAESSKVLQKPYLGAFDVEVLCIARKYGYKIKEVSVKWTYVKTTRLRIFNSSINMFKDVLKIKLNSLKGLY